MKYLFFVLLCSIFLTSCEQEKRMNSLDPIKWEQRAVPTALPDSLTSGSTFISVYSQIYLRSLNDQTDLTATVSIHNPNLTDQIFIEKAVYFNTHGEAIRTYFSKAIYVDPMETVQIVIDGLDNEGGTGANFVFDWKIQPNNIEPIVEAVMVTTNSNQGISFVTNGKRIK